MPEASEADHATVQGILQRLGLAEAMPHQTSARIDRIVLHPVLGPLLLTVLLFLIFQAVCARAVWPMELIQSAAEAVAATVGGWLPEGHLRSLVVDGVIAGAGLSGCSFIPLLSSFACALPGILAARTIRNPRDRLVTNMIAPMLICSARLPVYALLIAAFIPQRSVAIGLWQRVEMFMRRVGTWILALTILLWFLATFPAPPEGFTGAAFEDSLAVRLGHLLAWYRFAPQCKVTLATVKRETGGWTMPLLMAACLFGRAYLAALITYRAAVALGWG